MEELKLFGMRVKELRTAGKMSQEKLGEKAGISSKYLSRIETGQQFPSIDNIKKLADAMNVELKDLFEFAHKTQKIGELRKNISKLLKEADEAKLRLAVKVLRAIVK